MSDHENPGSKNDLDLLFAQIFMYSSRQLCVPIFFTLISKLSIKSHVQAFPIFDLAIKMVKVNQRSSFENLESNLVSSDICQMSWPLVQGFKGSQKEDILKYFTIYGHGLKHKE